MKTLPKKIYYWSACGILVVATFVFNAQIASASVACTNLASDLSYNATDLSSNGEVTALQNFLSASGYMTAIPNGHFGPATLAAVIAFQAANKISSTGYVGPLTRVAITAASCGGNSISSPSTMSTATVPSTSTAVSNSNVTAPTAGATLSVGKNYTITWNGNGSGGYSLILEDQNGLSQGYITPNTLITNSYNWPVGQVFSGATNTYTGVPAGIYQIDVRSAYGGAPDMISGRFNIVTPPLAINSILPTTISTSTSQTMVLYGSGFNSLATIVVDGNYGLPANILYTSLDGTVLVFSLPPGVSVGTHDLYVSNSSGPVPSAMFTVTP